MALITTKKPSVLKWLFKKNNHVLEFNSDDGTKTVNFAEITIAGITKPIVIFPMLDGSFWFSFKRYFNVLVRDIEDTIDPTTLVKTDVNTFVFDWTKVVAIPLINYKIVHTDATEVSDSFTPFVINGVENIYPHKRGITIDGLNSLVLSPLKTDSSIRYHMRYWDGYPFDFGLSQAIPNIVSPQKFKNLTNGVETPDITLPFSAQRIFISNGDTTMTIEDHLPLIFGKNEIRIDEANNTNVFIELFKEQSKCGVYLKWFNKSGGFTHWLFNETHQETVRTRGLGLINNDFNELDDTVSPKKSLGRTTQEEWSLKAEELTTEDVNLIRSLFDSPLIYLFTGERFSQNDGKDWLEVDLASTNFNPRDWRGNIPEITFRIRFPETENILR